MCYIPQSVIKESNDEALKEVGDPIDVNRIKMEQIRCIFRMYSYLYDVRCGLIQIYNYGLKVGERNTEEKNHWSEFATFSNVLCYFRAMGYIDGEKQIQFKNYESWCKKMFEGLNNQNHMKMLD